MSHKARTEGLIIKELGGELAVYDEREHRAHELNATAATVWRSCDGRTSSAQIAEAVAAQSELPADEGIVHMALDQLSRAGLLEESSPPAGALVSRREVVQRLSLVGTAAVLLPAVTTIVAPTRAMAQSGPPQQPTPGTPMMNPTPFSMPTAMPTVSP